MSAVTLQRGYAPAVPASSPTLLLDLQDLRVDAPSGEPIVAKLSLQVAQGGIVGIIGESGSGKTTTALALLGHARNGARIRGGTLTIADEAIELGRGAGAHRIAGRLVSYVPQNPGAALNPGMRIDTIIAEFARLHHPAAAVGEAIASALRAADLPTEGGFLRRYPHQISGGQQQRVALAAALVGRPRLLVLDEPTAGLDIPTRDRVIDALIAINRRLGIAMVCVSHDLTAVARFAERILVMQAGRIVEEGPTASLLKRPAHAYTRQLLDAMPVPRPNDTRADAGTPVLTVSHLAAHHGPGTSGIADVSFTIAKGRCLALMGASGSGKTTIARVIAGLHRPAGGEILLDGLPLAGDPRSRSADARRRIQIILQDPQETLNPRETVRAAIGRPLRELRGLRREDADREVDRLLATVRLDTRFASRFPSELSGGERQRVSIARALAAEPELLICDEITTALDASVQASILALLSDLRRTFDLSILLISHDPGVVAALADDVVILDGGAIVRNGPVATVLPLAFTENPNQGNTI